MENLTNATTANKEEVKVMKSGDFRGKNRCQKLRAKEGIVFAEPKNIAYDTAIAAKEIIRGYFEDRYQKDQFAELVGQAVGVDEDNTTDYIKIRQNRLVACLNRYVDSETRTPIKHESKLLTLPTGQVVRISPDLIFDDGETLEVVLVRSGKCDIKKKGRKKDTSLDSCIELYLLILYGREYCKDNNLKRKVSSSYYFLRKDYDYKDGGSLDPEFFGSNVVTLEDKEPDKLDKVFNLCIEDFNEGEEICDEEDCKKCSLNAACHYQKAKEVLETKSLSSKTGKIIPSDAQQQIIDFRKGVCRVNATAGSGKTECMTERTVRMIEEGVNPSEILMITFTDAGATEMKERIIKKCMDRNLAVDGDKLRVMTFHTFYYGIVKDNYEECGFSRIPNVIDNVNNGTVVANLINEDRVNGLDYANFYMDMPNCRGALGVAKKVFAMIKEKNINPDAFDAQEQLACAIKDSALYRFIDGNVENKMLSLYKVYDERLKEENLLQYADMENLARSVIDNHAGYLEMYGFRHIIVDEFQDTSTGQLDTVRDLTRCEAFESLMVVGDDSQSIYSFRGTTNQNILEFFDLIGMKGQDMYLSENRRSVPEILKLANAVNDLNEEKVDKEMVAVRATTGNNVAVHGFHNKDDEYRHIAGNIKHLIDSGEYKPEDIAFISFKRADMVTMSAALSKVGVPFVVKTPLKLMDNSRVQAALSLGEAFYQPEADNLYFNYLVARYDGEILNRPEEEVKNEVQKMRNQFECIDMQDLDTQKRIMHEYLEAIKGNDEIYSHFLELVYAQEDFLSEVEYIHNFRIYGEMEEKKMEQNYAGVVLTTAHSSKGLEWPVCFVSVSSFDNASLHRGGKTVQKRIEEVRRLLFVAITRARDLLCLTGQYITCGNMKEGYTYNQFLKELFDVTGVPYNITDPKAGIKSKLSSYRRRKNLSEDEKKEMKNLELRLKRLEEMVFYDFCA